MKQKIFRVATALVLYASTALAQSGVGINQPVPDSSAALDIVSSTQGILIPRMPSLEIQGMSSPANGLLVYNTDDNSIYINRGTATTPEWNNVGEDMKVGFLVYLDGGMFIPFNVPTTVQFNNIQFNHGNHYNSGFYYVVPYDGVYHFNTGVTAANMAQGDDWLVEIWVDAAVMASSTSTQAGNFTDFTESASVTLDLTEGERVHVRATTMAGGVNTSIITTRNWFSGHRLY